MFHTRKTLNFKIARGEVLSYPELSWPRLLEATQPGPRRIKRKELQNIQSGCCGDEESVRQTSIMMTMTIMMIMRITVTDRNNGKANNDSGTYVL